MIAVLIEDALMDLGCAVIGPVGRLDAALRLAAESDLDGAILDVNIRGGQVFPVAEALRTRGIPFVLASGYGDWALPEGFRDQMRLTKPFSIADLTGKVRHLCARCSPPVTLREE